MMQEIGKMSIDQKKQMGPLLNSLKNDIISQIDQKKKELENIAIDKALENESIDMSLPINLSEGTLHPVQQVMEEMAVIFSSMGFSIALGPDIEMIFITLQRLISRQVTQLGICMILFSCPLKMTR
jgi:phenylalanyl-tRNA synthetase alpha chain